MWLMGAVENLKNIVLIKYERLQWMPMLREEAEAQILHYDKMIRRVVHEKVIGGGNCFYNGMECAGLCGRREFVRCTGG